MLYAMSDDARRANVWGSLSIFAWEKIAGLVINFREVPEQPKFIQTIKRC